MKREKRGKMKKVTRSTDWLTSRYSDEELREMKIHAHVEADAQLKGVIKMTNEEAIEMFSVAVTAELCERKRDLYRIAIKALEKQIPKKPIISHMFDDTFACNCPICGGDLLHDYGEYCPDCGQAIDWSDE